MSSRPLPEFPYGHSRNIPIIAMAGEELSHPVTRKQTTRPFETDVACHTTTIDQAVFVATNREIYEQQRFNQKQYIAK